MSDRYERAVMRACLPLLIVLVLSTLSTRSFAHQGHSNRAPWDVCATQSLGDACQWEDDAHALYIGTCRQIGEALMCVRQKPIQYVGAPAPQREESSLTLSPALLLSLCVLGGAALCVGVLIRRRLVT